MNLVQLNLDLCRALGVKDSHTVAAVTLRIRPDAMPTLTVERHLKDADGLQTASEMLRLVPEHVATIPSKPVELKRLPAGRCDVMVLQADVPLTADQAADLGAYVKAQCGLDVLVLPKGFSAVGAATRSEPEQAATVRHGASAGCTAEELDKQLSTVADRMRRDIAR